MLLNTRKKTWVKFNPGLSANQPSNNWAQGSHRQAHKKLKKGHRNKMGYL